MNSIDKAIKIIDEYSTVWLVEGEDDRTGRYKQYTTRGKSKEEAKREGEKFGLSNVTVRKYN